jgi:integrase
MSQQVNIFLDSLNSDYTKEQYLGHWDRYQKNAPTDSQEPMVIQNNIISYLMLMKREGLSHSYRNSAFSAIKHYYSMNDIILNWRKISMFLGEKTSDNELRGYTREEIQMMLKVADVKYRAIILTLASTGMRRKALTRITRDDLQYVKEHKLFKIKIYNRTPHEQICFTTPEAAEAINLHLEMNKEDNGRKELFYFKTPKNLTITLRQIQIRSGVGSEHIGNGEKVGQARNSIPAVNGLKKFCITQLAKSKVDTEIVKVLTDHSIGVRGSYVEYTEDDLLEEYLKAVNNLTINEENRLKTENTELKKTKSEVQALKEQVELLQARDKERMKTVDAIE